MYVQPTGLRWEGELSRQIFLRILSPQLVTKCLPLVSQHLLRRCACLQMNVGDRMKLGRIGVDECAFQWFSARQSEMG